MMTRRATMTEGMPRRAAGQSRPASEQPSRRGAPSDTVSCTGASRV
jgi:hypothetical protein